MIYRQHTIFSVYCQVQASLAATESQLTEAKKQYDIMLEGKKIELSKHLKELSLKNDQVLRFFQLYPVWHFAISITSDS